MFLLKGDIFIGQPKFKCFGQKQCFLSNFYFPCKEVKGSVVVTPCAAVCIPGHQGGHHMLCSRRAKQPPMNPKEPVKIWTDFGLLWMVKRSLIISINEKAESNLELIWLGFFPLSCALQITVRSLLKIFTGCSSYSKSLHLFFGSVRKKKKENTPDL